jgi:Nucleotide modification associated domain 2
VARDYGFAPNPFYGSCTLATCISPIRKSASIGDWVIGTGSATKGLQGRLVYCMRVSQTLTLTEYWNDEAFIRKRPRLDSSSKAAYGDNIYHRSPQGSWLQADSHHSLEDGSVNPANVISDTKVDRMLVGASYSYWGEDAIAIPEEFTGPDVSVVRSGIGYRCHYPLRFAGAFDAWLETQAGLGFEGRPADW